MIVCQKPLGAMVKMIVMDLDGTLLDHNENISQYTLSIMEKKENKNCNRNGNWSKGSDQGRSLM